MTHNSQDLMIQQAEQTADILAQFKRLDKAYNELQRIKRHPSEAILALLETANISDQDFNEAENVIAHKRSNVIELMHDHFKSLV